MAEQGDRPVLSPAFEGGVGVCLPRRNHDVLLGDDPPAPEQANFGMSIRRTTETGSYPPHPWASPT